MPKFYYVARNRTGVKETGTEEALNQEDAVTKIQSKGLIVVNIIPEIAQSAQGMAYADNLAKVKFKPKHGGVTGDDLTLFCRQLSTLIGAGVTILTSLNIIARQVSSRKLYQVIVDLTKNMEAGLSFHEAMAVHPKVFSDFWINLVESGEASGNLAIVLNRLATYLEKAAEFKRKIISALIYPAILTCAGLGALLFLSIKIVPTFTEIFKSFNITLPFLTQVLVWVSVFLRKFMPLIILGIVGGIFLFKKYVKTKAGRRSFENFKFKLPVFGEFFLSMNIERFSSGMSTLLESGVPILYSLEISERSVDNLVMSDIIRNIKDDVREGKPLRESLERSGFFEPMVIQMVSIGEEIGELPQMFRRINSFYQEYCDTFLSRFVAMFEPFVLIFIGGIIGVMVIGMFLPIFELSKISG
jgi:type IV pilus assembly protein PilC